MCCVLYLHCHHGCALFFNNSIICCQCFLINRSGPGLCIKSILSIKHAHKTFSSGSYTTDCKPSIGFIYQVRSDLSQPAIKSISGSNSEICYMIIVGWNINQQVELRPNSLLKSRVFYLHLRQKGDNCTSDFSDIRESGVRCATPFIQSFCHDHIFSKGPS